jgi:chromosome partitioning protein
LLKAGQRVATIDLDSRQQSFTHYIENRRAWSERARVKLEMPTHYCVPRADNNSLDANEAQEFASFSAAISAIEHDHDVVVVDTPGADTYLMRLAHSMADTLVTPLNDSFVDFDVLGTLDPTNFTVTGESHYAEMVRESRRQRRLVDGKLTDWIVVRNRLSALGSRNKRLVGEGITELSKRMGFRSVDGFAERVVYREFFPRGLTALDDLDETTLGVRPNMSHLTAREEVIGLLNLLHLPLSENGKRRAAARAEWYSVMDQPLQVHDILA